MVTTTDKSSDRTLRKVLMANGWFSIISGAVAAGLSAPLADYMEIPFAVLVLVGLGVVAFGVLTLINVRRELLDRPQAIATTLADVTWVIGAVGILAAFPGSMSSEGKVLLAGVSAVVALFAISQAAVLRRSPGRVS